MKQSLRSFFMVFLLFMSLVRAVAQTPTSVSGRVLGYLSNRIGDYDGLRLLTATREVRLFFPPHTAARIRQLAAIRQRITADMEPRRAKPGPARPGFGDEGSETEPTNYQLIRLRNASSGLAFQLSDLPPPPPQQGQVVQSEGSLVEKIHDEQGQLSALLTDKYLIELKPHQVEQINSLLAGVQRLGFTGFERTVGGFVNRTGRPVLHPTSLTIRGQTFAL